MGVVSLLGFTASKILVLRYHQPQLQEAFKAGLGVLTKTNYLRLG